MQIILMLILTSMTLAAAVYTHYRIPYHTVRQHRGFAHSILVIAGCIFGWVVTQRYMETGIMEVLIFLSTFGAAHLPAAAILFIKRQRNSGES